VVQGKAKAMLRKWSPLGRSAAPGNAERQSEWIASARCFSFAPAGDSTLQEIGELGSSAAVS